MNRFVSRRRELLEPYECRIHVEFCILLLKNAGLSGQVARTFIICVARSARPTEMGNRTLRITQSSDSTGQYRAELALEGDGLARQTATATFEFELSPQHREDIRWYLEDYLQYPHDPAPTVAARIEGDLKNLGVDLFKKVFQSDDDARDLWATLRQQLDDTRIEISTSVAEATSIPWELIRDPKTDAALALRAESFVRSQPQAAQRPELPQTESGPIRILLVICRPSGDDDVPFRSVATQLIKGLGDQAEDRFQLDVLRPATYERLSRVLNDVIRRASRITSSTSTGTGCTPKWPTQTARLSG